MAINQIFVSLTKELSKILLGTTGIEELSIIFNPQIEQKMALVQLHREAM